MTLHAITLVPVLILGAVWASFGVPVEAWCAVGLLFALHLATRQI